CAQKVSVESTTRLTTNWPVAGLGVTACAQSSAMPTTHASLWAVLSVAFGAPDAAVALATAPVPVACLNATIVKVTVKPAVFAVALTETPVRMPPALAVQTSVSPRPAFSRPIRCQVSPPPGAGAPRPPAAGPRPATSATSRSPVAVVVTFAVALLLPTAVVSVSKAGSGVTVSFSDPQVLADARSLASPE